MTWYWFYFEKIAKSQKKTESQNEPKRIKKNKQNESQGIALRNIYTKFGVNWKMFRHRTEDTYRHTFETVTELQIHWLIGLRYELKVTYSSDIYSNNITDTAGSSNAKEYVTWSFTLLFESFGRMFWMIYHKDNEAARKIFTVIHE